MSRFAIQQISLNNTLYPGVEGYQLDRGVEVQSDGSDGVVYETAHHVVRKRPSVDLTTYSLKAIVAALNGGTDFPVLAFDAVNGLLMYGAKQAANAVGYAGGSVHPTRQSLRGLIYLAGIRWSPGQKAMASLRALCISPDGTTGAIVESTASLPTLPVPDFGFALTAASAGAQTITEFGSLDLAIDPRFDFDYSAGLPEPVSIIGAGVNGKLAITAALETGDVDLGAGTGACAFTFSRFTTGGGFGTDTLTLTLNSAWSNEERLGGSNGQPMAKGLLVRSRYNGTTKPLTWSST